MALADRADLAVRLTLDDRQFAGGIRRTQRSLAGLGQSAGRVGRGVGQIGAGLARAGLLLGGAAVTGIAAVAKAAIAFEDAFAGVRKTVSEAELAAAGLTFEDLALSFRKMATEIPIAATELARIGETAGALGIAVTDIDDFTGVVAKLGVTTDLTSDQAAEALGKIGTILGLTGPQFEQFADALVGLGNSGASVESEIIEVTKRFAAMGRQAGLSVEQILALSSAASSLGIEPEAAGSALSRIFANMATEIANGTKKGKEFAEITGDSMEELRRRIDKGDALGILMETLEGISGLSRTESASVLKALGITNVRDRNAILLMAQNLDVVNDQLTVAANSTGALEAEAKKRFATVAQTLVRLKNNAIEAAITMGNEFLPAIGRAAERAIAFLQQPDVKGELQQLGRDIGSFIDGIDWNKVAEGARSIGSAMKTALDFVIAIAQALDKLPNEIKGAALGFLALNKLSGGLIGAGVGNVAGGLAGAAATGLGARLPGVGRLFAQPVFVTNWPVGGLGGGVGGKAGAAGAGLGLLGGAFALTAVAGIELAIADALGKGLRQAVTGSEAPLSKDYVLATLGPVEVGLFRSQVQAIKEGFAPTAPIPVTPQGLSPDERQEINDRRARDFRALTSLEQVRQKSEANRIAIVTSQRAIVSAGNSDRAAIVSAVSGTRGAIVSSINSDRAAVVTAIRQNRPIVNVSVSVSGARKRVVSNYQSGTQNTRGGPTEFD